MCDPDQTDHLSEFNNAKILLYFVSQSGYFGIFKIKMLQVLRFCGGFAFSLFFFETFASQRKIRT